MIYVSGDASFVRDCASGVPIVYPRYSDSAEVAALVAHIFGVTPSALNCSSMRAKSIGPNQSTTA